MSLTHSQQITAFSIRHDSGRCEQGNFGICRYRSHHRRRYRPRLAGSRRCNRYRITDFRDFQSKLKVLHTIIAYALIAVGRPRYLPAYGIGRSPLILGAGGAGLLQFLGAKPQTTGGVSMKRGHRAGYRSTLSGVGSVSLASGTSDLGIVLTIIGVLGASVTQLAGSASPTVVATAATKSA